MGRSNRCLGLCVGLLLLSRAAQAATLTWDPNPEPGITGYIVSVGTSPGTYTQNINVGNTTSYVFNDLDPYRTYYFAISAYDAAGLTSPYSGEVIRPAQAARTPDFGTVGTGPSGTADLIWQHDSGLLSVWYMDGPNLVDAAYLTPSSVSDTNWRIAGTGDFDRDNNMDLVLRNSVTGQVDVWLMEGVNLRSVGVVSTVPDAAWRIAAVADMNGDWYPDLIWQHGTIGNLAVWFMQGTSPIGFARTSPGTIPVNTWSIVGAGDFNADGSSDLIWQHKDGWLSVWFMNGVSLVDARYLSPSSISTRWKVVSVADYNSDGRPDLIFQRDDGYLGAWFLDALNVVSSPLLNPSVVSGGKWKIVGPK